MALPSAAFELPSTNVNAFCGRAKAPSNAFWAIATLPSSESIAGGSWMPTTCRSSFSPVEDCTTSGLPTFRSCSSAKPLVTSAPPSSSPASEPLTHL